MISIYGEDGTDTPERNFNVDLGSNLRATICNFVQETEQIDLSNWELEVDIRVRKTDKEPAVECTVENTLLMVHGNSVYFNLPKKLIINRLGPGQYVYDLRAKPDFLANSYYPVKGYINIIERITRQD